MTVLNSVCWECKIAKWVSGEVTFPEEGIKLIIKHTQVEVVM